MSGVNDATRLSCNISRRRWPARFYTQCRWLPRATSTDGIWPPEWRKGKEPSALCRRQMRMYTLQQEMKLE